MMRGRYLHDDKMPVHCHKHRSIYNKVLLYDINEVVIIPPK